MAAKRRRRRRRRFSGNFILTLGMLLLLAAAILTSLNFIEDGQAGEAAGNALEQLLLAERDARDAARRASSETSSDEPAADSGGITLDPVYLNDNTSTPEGEMPVIEIDGYGYIGVLQIPSLDLTLPVISDWSYPALQIAPCRYEGSAYDGGMVIAGHNFDSHFGKLNQLEPGDEIRFVDLSGHTFTYAVAETEVLDATAIDQMVNGGWDLTLFTCTLSGETRFTVRCTLAGAGS